MAYVVTVPGYAEHKFDTMAQVNDFYRSLGQDERAVFRVYTELPTSPAVIERKAKHRVDAARVIALMKERDCSRSWALELLRREARGYKPAKPGRPRKLTKEALQIAVRVLTDDAKPMEEACLQDKP